MYKAYDAKNNSPIRRTFMYMSLLNFYIVSIMLLFIKKVLEKGHFLGNLEIDKNLLFWFVLAIGVCIAIHLMFSRKSFNYFEGKFSKYVELNSRIKLWMLIAFPFVLLFLSFFIYVLLFGGQILGKEIVGIWPS